VDQVNQNEILFLCFRSFPFEKLHRRIDAILEGILIETHYLVIRPMENACQHGKAIVKP
jgi:hypothetical protein